MEWLCFAVVIALLTLLAWVADGFEDPIKTADRVARMRHAYLRRTDPELERIANKCGAAAAYYARRRDYP